MHDVIVVGAGPAGAMVAHGLASRGASVVILEKENLPRYKVCGGGVTGRAADFLRDQLLGKNLPDRVVEDRVYQVTLTYRGGWPVTVQNERTIVYMTMRSELDHWLTMEAVAAGAELRQNVRVTGVAQNAENVSVETSDGPMQARVLVGADGVNSTVGRQLDLGQRHEKALALEAELSVPPGSLESHQGSVLLDYGLRPNGYAWIFPKSEHLSVGVGASELDGRALKQRLATFRAQQNLEGHVDLERGYYLSVGDGLPEPLQAGRTLLVGDAAGLVDPLFGEGIYYALKSAGAATEVIAAALRHGAGPRALGKLETYAARLETDVLTELQAVRRFSEFFYRWSGLFHTAFVMRPAFLQRVMQALAGQIPLLEVLPRWLTR